MTTGLWEWWNLVYLVPLVVALLYLGVSVTFGLFEGHDADHEVDHDVDHDLGHDVVQDVGHDVGHGVDHHMDHDIHAGHHGDSAHSHGEGHAHSGELHPWAALLAAIDARSVTTGFALQILLITWGVCGLLVNLVLFGWLGSGWLPMGVSLIATAVASVFITRGINRTLGRLMPKDETAAQSREALEGRTADCLYAIDSDSGVAIVRDAFGHRHQVACRTNGPEVPRGAEIVLLEYVPLGDYFLVEAVPDVMHEQPERLAAAGPSAAEWVDDEVEAKA